MIINGARPLTDDPKEPAALPLNVKAPVVAVPEFCPVCVPSEVASAVLGPWLRFSGGIPIDPPIAVAGSIIGSIGGIGCIGAIMA